MCVCERAWMRTCMYAYVYTYVEYRPTSFCRRAILYLPTANMFKSVRPSVYNKYVFVRVRVRVRERVRVRVRVRERVRERVRVRV